MRIEEQAHLLSIFHDGTFDKIELDGKDINYSIDIQYLAELINPNYRYFNGIFRRYKCFEFEIWSKEQIVTDINVLSSMDLEILSVEISEDKLIVFCNIDDGGGNLIIETDDIIIYDEEGNEVTLEKLIDICRLYWESK